MEQKNSGHLYLIPAMGAFRNCCQCSYIKFSISTYIAFYSSGKEVNYA